MTAFHDRLVLSVELLVRNDLLIARGAKSTESIRGTSPETDVRISKYEAVCAVSNEAIRKTTHEALCAMRTFAKPLMCALPSSSDRPFFFYICSSFCSFFFFFFFFFFLCTQTVRLSRPSIIEIALHHHPSISLTDPGASISHFGR